jgi:hypothetical protein
MATISMPNKESFEAIPLPPTQTQPTLARFRLQVDRQTKATFHKLSDAEKAGQEIKKAHPVVQVSVYDAEERRQTVL